MNSAKYFFQFVFIIFVVNLYSQDGEEYKNSEYSYSIIFPEGWKYYEAKEHYYVIRCELREVDTLKKPADGTISVMILKLEGDLTQEETAEQNMKVINLMGKDIEEIKNEKISLNGFEALHLEYAYNFNNKEFPERRIETRYYLQKDDLLYCIYYSGKEEVYNKYKEIINNSLSSFKFL